MNGSSAFQAGGLLRDHTGQFMKAFVAKMNGSSAFQAELLGLWKGLVMAKDMQIQYLEVEVDASEVVKYMSNDSPNLNLHQLLISRCKSLLFDSDWQVRIKQIARSGNQAADWLASFAETCNENFLILNNPPDGLVTVMEIDSLMNEHM